ARQRIQRRAIGVARQRFGDANEARAERERLHAREGVLQRVEELEQKPAVEIHRAGDVTERDELGAAQLSLALCELDDIAAGFERKADRATQIDADAAATARGPPPSAATRVEAARQHRRQALDVG